MVANGASPRRRGSLAAPPTFSKGQGFMAGGEGTENFLATLWVVGKLGMPVVR